MNDLDKQIVRIGLMTVFYSLAAGIAIMLYSGNIYLGIAVFCFAMATAPIAKQ